MTIEYPIHPLTSFAGVLLVVLVSMPFASAQESPERWYLEVDAAQQRYDEHVSSSEFGGMTRYRDVLVATLDESQVPYDDVRCRARWCVIEGASPVPEFERTWIQAEIMLLDRVGGFEAFGVNDHARQRWVMMVERSTR